MPPRRSSRTFLIGLLFGVVLAALGAGNAIAQWASGAFTGTLTTANGGTSLHFNDSGAVVLLGCVVFLANLLLTFIAGILAARRTGKIGSGALAGLLASVLGVLLGELVLAALILAAPPQLASSSGGDLTPAQTQQLLLWATAVGTVLGLVFNGGFGILMGVVGGVIGANGYRRWQAAHPSPYAASMAGPPPDRWSPGSDPNPLYPGS